MSNYTRPGELYVSRKTLWMLQRLQAAKRTVDDTVTCDSLAEGILAEHLLTNYPALGELYDQREQANKQAEQIVMERLKK